MHTKLINTKMQQYKRRNQSSHQRIAFNHDHQDKQNLPKYERFLNNKKSQRNYLIQAEKLIMMERMKDIVADNVQYFRNILEANDVPRPNKLTLKLPAKSLPSSYQAEFNKKQLYQSQSTSVDVKRDQHHQPHNFSESKLPLSTTYQNEFKRFKQINSHEKRKLKFSELPKRSFTSNAPTFLDTHNMLQYRNWGTGSVMPSMKPKPEAATLDIPFKATSMYKTEFHSVVLPKTQIVSHEESYPQSIDLWMGKSSYEKDFDKKPVRGQQKGYKPKETPGSTNLPFKSTTEYKQSFLESVSLGSSQIQRQKKRQDSSKRLTNNDIEKLVMEL